MELSAGVLVEHYRVHHELFCRSVIHFVIADVVGLRCSNLDANMRARIHQEYFGGRLVKLLKMWNVEFSRVVQRIPAELVPHIDILTPGLALTMSAEGLVEHFDGEIVLHVAQPMKESSACFIDREQIKSRLL